VATSADIGRYNEHIKRKELKTKMMYKFMELPDKTEITHSDVREDGTVKVCVERPVEGDFKTACCTIPGYGWYDVEGYTANELSENRKILESLSHLIIRFARNGGFENASGF
jgi:hypothetical protein